MQTLGRIPGGLLVVIEGIDGAGKTSQASLIAQYFGERGIAAIMSKEPTSGKWGRKLRESAASGRADPVAELELFLKDRGEHVERTIGPALEEGMVVILDRYYFSSAAYQGARSNNVEEIFTKNEAFAPEPDLLMIVDLPVDVALKRVGVRGDSPDHFEKEDYLSKVREIFLSIERPYKQVINGDRQFREIHTDVLDACITAAKKKLETATRDEELRARANLDI